MIPVHCIAVTGREAVSSPSKSHSYAATPSFSLEAARDLSAYLCDFQMLFLKIKVTDSTGQSAIEKEKNAYRNERHSRVMF